MAGRSPEGPARRLFHILPQLRVAIHVFSGVGDISARSAPTLAVILHYDWILALLALASAPFLLLTSRRLIRGMRTHQQEVRQWAAA